MSDTRDPTILTRIRRILGSAFLVYALLVATHLGEFWPFSIYPMFSRGGHTWVRSVVREVTPVDSGRSAPGPANTTDRGVATGAAGPVQYVESMVGHSIDDPDFWSDVDIDHLAGEPFPLVPQGINQNDIANFVSKSTDWSESRVSAMRKVYGSVVSERSLLVYRVEGRLGDDRSVSVRYQPFILMTPDTTIVHPSSHEDGEEMADAEVVEP